MPTVPLLPPNMLQQQSVTGGIDPQNFLMAAADLHQQGQLSSPAGPKPQLQTGKAPGRKSKLKVLK